jgi:hypothetical protein
LVSFDDVGLHLILGQVGKTEPGQGGIQSQSDIVERQLAFDADVDLAPVLLEFLDVEPAIELAFTQPGSRADVDGGQRQWAKIKLTPCLPSKSEATDVEMPNLVRITFARKQWVNSSGSRVTALAG